MTEALEPKANEGNQLELIQLQAQAKDKGVERMGPSGLLGQ